MGQDDPLKFFILGCQRTGTTMLRLIMDSHPDIHCFDEWKGYSALLHGNYSNTKQAKLLGFKCPDWTELFLESDIHHKILGQSQILFMLRDVRGCIASMLKLKTGNGNFFNGLQINWPDSPYCPPKQLAIIRRLNCPEHRLAALYWRTKTYQYVEMVKRGLPVLPVHYEQFVQFPESHLKIICQFLQVPWDDRLLRHYKQPHDESPGGKAVGNTALNRPIDQSSIMLWKSIFTAEQEAAILETAGEINDYISVLRGEKKEGGVSQY
jgi:hypothetical protein